MIDDFVHWLRAEAVPLGLAVALHVALGLLLVLGKGFITAEPLDAPGRGVEHEPIQAVVVKESDFKAAQATIEHAKQARQARVQKLKEQAQAAREAREKEEQRLARLKKNQQEAEQQAARAAQAHKEKLARLKRQAQEAAEQREAAQAAAKKAKADAEAARKVREAEQARIAKAKAEAAAKAKAEAEARAKAQAAAERKAQMQAAMKEEAARHRKRAQGNWIAAIRATVTGNWNRPLSAPANLDCRVRITQLSSGEVIGVDILACNGGAAVQQSVKSAIYKSSPLPTPADPEVFERQIVFDFNPDGNS